LAKLTSRIINKEVTDKKAFCAFLAGYDI